MLASASHVPSPVDPDFMRLIEGYSLTTAEILYRMPDHPLFLQTYVWQDFDQAPYFPTLQRFLDFWERSLDGRLHSVRVTSSCLVSPREIAVARTLMRLH
ncbi:hypothetical protein E8L99_20505 [Phreatobacter aquaticus]|uniref:Protein usg n=1 Tax=Phreatobacter aquaticus TaxID=2570229 RepID=A0A4D7QRT2_9HYPH|nr:hypothetical protein [Phreatobacter aquaticus]QCK87964.1 hypothetical protein E8L99_20505 [Phreatobacter aquaticus]